LYKQKGDLLWEFLEKESALGFAKLYSEIMHLYTEENIKDMYRNQFVKGEFPVDKIQEAMDSLTPNNCIISILKNKHKFIKEEDYLVEKWYGTKYTIGKFSNILMV
jgi:hypothetical protein